MLPDGSAATQRQFLRLSFQRRPSLHACGEQVATRGVVTGKGSAENVVHLGDPRRRLSAANSNPHITTGQAGRLEARWTAHQHESALHRALDKLAAGAGQLEIAVALLALAHLQCTGAGQEVDGYVNWRTVVAVMNQQP